MDKKYIKYQEPRVGIAQLTINRPEALNALNLEVLNELRESLEEVIADESIRVLVITGEGRSFVAGADIAQMSEMTAMEGLEFGRFGATVFRAIEQSPIPVIAAVNGFALGGGCELAMACDIRIASDKAKFGQPEVGLGIIPGFTGTQRLPRLVGVAKAKELIYTAEIIRAEEAQAIGLVNKVVPADKLLEETYAMAEKIASKAPIAVRLSKKSIDTGMQTDIDTAITVENDLFGLCFSTADQKAEMKAFLKKEIPNFQNQ